MNSGDTIGKYRLVSRLGRGGMGEVWLARASGYGGFSKTVVLKTLLPELANDPLFIDLLAREAKTCSTLSHPNLIEVFDFTKHDGVYLLAMEHVRGQPLSAILKTAHARGLDVPAWFALRIAWDCCCGVQAAHERGVIHCDLSPSNVMVTYTGVTKVLDFGVAHTTALGPKSDRLKGKYSYMAPERIKTRSTDRRTDIYALGVMLYLLFTGRLPFTGESDAELLYKITHEKLVLPSAVATIDPTIEGVILRAMHPDPARRFQTLTEVLAALAPCLDGHLGTYGQQHVAAFVNALFDEAEPGVLPPLPPLVPPPPAAPAAPRTRMPSFGDEVEEIELELDSTSYAVPASVHDVATTPVRAPAAASLPAVPAPAARRPLGSVQIPPLAKPARPAPIAAFAQASTPHEPKTAVQSLFGERTSQPSAVAGLFARGTRDDVRDRLGDDGAPDASDDDGRVVSEIDAKAERTRSLFGAYSPRTQAREVVWPWPTRTKSE